MSGVIAIRALLANNANLLAVVPATKIMAGVIPIETVLPAIAVSHISTVERNTVSMADVGVMATERVQVTVQAKTYLDQKSILELVRKACPNTRGTVNGIAVDSILPELAGPDLRDDEVEPPLFIQSRDFIVKFVESST
jgi:hypothetical protein